jgi:hypothetical protein
MDKSKIKKCEYCEKYYFANQPHWLKSSACKGMEKVIKDFRELNNIPVWEVWTLSVGIEDCLIGFNYDEKQSIRNFMKMIWNKIELINLTK